MQLKVSTRWPWARSPRAVVLLDQAVVSGGNLALVLVLAKLQTGKEFELLAVALLAQQFVTGVGLALLGDPLQSIGPGWGGYSDDASWSWTHWGGASLAVVVGAGTGVVLWLGLFDWLRPELSAAAVASMIGASSVVRGYYEIVRRLHYSRSDVRGALLQGSAATAWSVALVAVIASLPSTHAMRTTLAVIFILSLGQLFASVASVRRLGGGQPKLSEVLGGLKRTAWWGRWLLGTFLLSYAGTSGVVLMAGGVLGSWVVGATRLAQSMVGPFTVAFLALENTLPVKAALARAHGADWRLLRGVAVSGAWGVTAAAGLIVVLGELVLANFYSAAPAGTGAILRTLCVLQLPVFFSLIAKTGLRTIHVTSPIFEAYVISAAATASLAPWLISAHGFPGFLVSLAIGPVVACAWQGVRYVTHPARHSLGGLE